MAKKQGDIRFGVQFQVDKSGLNELKTSLQNLTAMSDKELIKINPKAATEDLNEIRKSVEQVQKALEDSFNPKLDTINLSKFKKSLNDLNIPKLKADFDKFGESGKNAFRNLTVEIITTKRHLKESSQWLDKMAETLSNTVRWTIASTAVNAITGSVQKAFNYTQKLDKSLNDIVIVTGKGSDEMEKFARKANDAAKALGATTTDYTKASLIYYQQGLSDREVQARADVTTKVANVTGQSADTTSEQLTAIWNGYKVSAQEAELYIDKVSAVAATTAADLEELATGMSKVASAANIMGVDIDQLNAQLATIVSVTREAPESIGTALKTVYARMSDIEAGLDTETTLGEYTKQMEALGIKALNANGDLRDMGEVVEEIGGKWDTFNRNQQVALAQVIAGTRQYSRMMALFDNWDMYESAKSTSEQSIGALQQQNDRYMDSMEAHLNQLTAATEGLYDTLLDPESLNPLIDVLTNVVGLMDQMIQGLGGGGQLLMNLGAIGLNVFGNQITKGISQSIRNIQGFKENLQQAASEAMLLQQYGIANVKDERTKEFVDIARQRLEIADKLSQEEREASDALIIQTNELYKQQDILLEKQRLAKEVAKNYTGQELDFNNLDQVKKDITAVSFDNLDSSAIVNIIKARKEVDKRNIRVNAAERGAEAAYDTMDEERFDAKWKEYDEQVLLRAKATDEFSRAQDEAKVSLTQMMQALLASADANDKSSVASKANAEELEELKQIVKTVTDAFDEEGNVKAKDTKQIEKANEAIKQYNKLMEKMKKRGKEVADGLKQLSVDLKNNQEELDKNKAALKALKDSFNLTKAIGSVGDLAGGIANVASGFSTLKNLANVWDNDALTGGEKLLQTITNIGFALPMMANGFANVKNNINALTNLFNLGKTALVEYYGTTAAGAKIVQASKMEEMLSTQAYFAMLKTTNKEKNKEILQTILAAKCGDEDAKVKLKQALSQKALAGAIGSTTKFIWSQTVALLANPATWILLAIAAAVAAVTVAVNLGTKEYNKYNLAMEKASQAAEHQKQVYEDVKKAYEDLKKSIEDYDNSQKAIDDLTEGTEEWRDAIIEANKEITELIQKYPQLAKYLNTDGFGRMTFDEEGLKQAASAAKDSMNLAYSQSLAANVNYNNARELAKAETISHNSEYTTFTSWLEGYGKSLLAPWFVTEAIIKKDASSPYKDETSTEDIIKIAEYLNTTEGSQMTVTEAARSVLGDVSDAQIKALEKNSEEIKKLSNEIKLNSASNEILNEQIISGYLSQFTNYNNAEYKGVIDEVMGERYAAELEKQKSIYEDKGHGGGGKTDAEIQQAYAEMMVETGQWQSVQSTKDKGKNKGQYTYIDASGNIQSGVEIDDKVARQALAAYEAQKQAGNKQDLGKITNAIDKLVGTLPDVIEKTVLTSAFTNGGQGSVSALTGAQKEELQALLNNDQIRLSDDEAKTLGYDSAQQYYDAIQAAINAYDQRAKDLAGEFVDQIGTEAFNALTLAEQETISNWFKNFSEVEKSAAKDILQSVGENSTELMQEIMDTDWTNKNAIYDLTAKIQKMAPELDLVQVEEFINGLEKANNVFGEFNLKTTQESYKAIDQIMSSLKETGDIIDADQFKTLGERYEEYFITMADGTKKLIADATEFYNLVYQDRINEAKQQVKDAVGAYKEYQDTVTLKNNTRQYKTLAEVTGANQNDYNTAKTWVDAWLGTSVSKKAKRSDKSDTDYYKLDGAQATTFANIVQNLADAGLLDDQSRARIQADLNDNKTVYVKTMKDIQWLLSTYNVGSSSHIYTEAYQGLQNDVKSQNETELIKNVNESVDNYIATAGLKLLTEGIDNDIYNILSDENKQKINARIEELRSGIRTDFTEKNERQEFGADGFESLNTEVDKATMSFDHFSSALENTIDVLDRTDAQWNELIRLGINAQNAQSNKIRGLEDYQNNFKTNKLGDYFDTFAINELFNSEDVAKWMADPEKYAQEIQNAIDAAMTQDTSGALTGTYEDFNKEFNTYLQNASTDIPNAIKEWQDLLLQNLGLNVERFNAALNKEVNKIGAYVDFNETLRELYPDNNVLNGKTFSDDITLYKSQIDQLQQGFADLQDMRILSDEEYANWEAIYGAEALEGVISSSQYKENLQNVYNTTLEKTTALQESINQLEETQIAQMDEIAQGYADQISYLEEINSLYDHQISLAELVGKKNGETLEQYNTRIEGYYKAQENNLNTMRAKYQNEYEYWQGYLATLDPASDAYENARNKMLEAGKNATAMGVEYGQMVADNFKRTIENSVNELFEGLEWAKQELDWLRADAERYYNQVDAYFEINKLEAQIRKDMNSNANLNAQRKMNEFLEEQVASLREIDKLSEADLKRAQAKYDLLQAQIALEEAQANKTQMRRVRGADGSYSYEYVADIGAIAEKEQEVLEAQQAIMDLDKEEVRNHFDEVYDIAQEFIDKYVTAFEDMTINEKESALLGDIWNSLVEKLGGTSGIIAKLKESTQAAASALGITDLANITDAQMAELFPELNSDMYGLIKGWVNDPNAFNEATFNNLMSTTDADQAKAILSALGLATDANLGELNSTYSSMMSETASAMVDNKTALADLTTTVNTARDAYNNMANSLRSVIREMTIANMIASGSTANEAAEYVDQYFPVASAATGGYTGEWGSEGKFLLAHEKELILNKTDTANILDAVNIIRDLQFSLDASVAGRLADMMKSYDSSMHVWSQTRDQVIEQNIEINAEFPNATDSEEIEKAFEELLNMAAQRIAQR